MDYRYLKAFLLTAQYKSFSLAAKELSVAQSAISRQIRLLEESLGCQLMLRAPKHFSLTERGKALLKQGSQFDEWIQVEFHKTAPTIRIGTISGLLDHVILPVMKDSQINGKHVDFNIISAAPHRIVELLTEGEIDLCLTHMPVEINHLVCKKLFDVGVTLVSKTPVDVSKLETYPWIHMGGASYLKKLCSKVSKKMIQVNSLETILTLVEQGMGVATVPDYFLKGRGKDLKKRPLDFKGSIYLSYYKLDIWPVHLRAFVESLRSFQPA